MANLLITLIGIAFCALLLMAGASYISPQGFVEHNQASLNTTQVVNLVSDYNNLQIAVGHRPGYNDYTSVYGNGSANLKYTNTGATITSSATMSYTNANGQTVPIGTWKFVPGCAGGGLQDCFCMQINGATPVTYQATKVSALAQMNGTSQSRIEYSTPANGCATNTVTDPAQWPSTANGVPQSYWLTVRLVPAQGSGSYSAAVASNSSNPSTSTNPNYTYSPTTSPGTCAPYCGTSTQPITYACYRNDGVEVDLSYCGPTSSFPPTGQCTDYSTCTAVPYYGTCSCATSTAPYAGYNCNGDSNSFAPSVANCAPPTNTSSQTCNPTGCAQPGQCPTPNPTTAANYLVCPLSSSGSTAQNQNQSLGSWTCSGIYSGPSSGTCLASLNGQCPSPTTLANAGTCAVGSASGYNASTGQWTCTGPNGGVSSPTCQAPVAATCGTSATTCTIGTYAGDYNNASGTWTCDGLDGGPNKSCIMGISGVCDPNALDQCSVGIASGTSPGGNPPGSETDWNCSSTNGGGTAYCKATNGLCAASINTCLSGNYVAGTDNGTTTTWYCTGSSNGGATASCSKADPVNGACSTTAGQCTAGTATSVSDNGTTTTWTCNGSNGGSNNTSCSAPDAVCTDCAGITHANGTSWSYTSNTPLSTSCSKITCSPHGGCVTTSGTSYGSDTEIMNFTCTSGTVSLTSASNDDCQPTPVCGPPNCTSTASGPSPNPSCGYSIDGVCSSTPVLPATAPSNQATLCAVGTATSITDNGTTTSWYCGGLFGGTGTTCAAIDPPSGGGGGGPTGQICMGSNWGGPGGCTGICAPGYFAINSSFNGYNETCSFQCTNNFGTITVNCDAGNSGQ